MRRHAGSATVAWLVASALGDERPYADWFPGFARLDEVTAPSGGRYTPEVARDIRTALRLLMVTQDGLDALDGDEVRASIDRIPDAKGGAA